MISEKPKIEFEFDALYAEDGQRPPRKYIAKTDETIDLTDTEIQQVLTYIIEETPETEVIAVDKYGYYLGRVKESNDLINEIVPYGPPNGDPWTWRNNEWILLTGVDKHGYWLGIKRASELFKETSPPPNDFNGLPKWNFDLDEWYDGNSLGQQKINAIKSLMDHAKNLSIKIIPDITGQSTIYQKKYAEAVDYLKTRKPIYSNMSYISFEQILSPEKSLEDIANEIISAKNMADRNLYIIETTRRSSIDMINKATTYGDILAAESSFRKNLAILKPEYGAYGGYMEKITDDLKLEE